MLSIMVPVSLAVTVLHWSGWLSRISHVLSPVFRLLGLPAEAAAAFLTGALVNVYSGIAALGPIPLTSRQTTISAVMILICHNLLVETPLQKKAGSSAWRMVVLRVGGAFLAAVALNVLLPAPADAPASHMGPQEPAQALADVLLAWGEGMAYLCVKVFALILLLMWVQKTLSEFGLIRRISKALAPLLRVLGLPPEAGFLWVVANTLGLAYGSAVILEEIRGGAIGARDADYLNHSVAVCHSLFEDTILFAAVGASALWITLPRLALAAASVWALRLRDRPRSG